MTNVNLNVDISGALKYFDQVEKQSDFALSKTLNKLAFESAKKVMPQEVEKRFQGGATAYTKRGFKYKRSSKRELTAFVFIDAATHEYLSIQVEGGTRTPKNRKIIVPTKNTRLNKYGNITKGKRESFFNNTKKFFHGIPKGKSGTVYEGVWERYGGKRSRKIKMVVNYVDKATYKPKLPFKTIVHNFVGLKAKDYFLAEFDAAMRSAR